MIRNANKHSAKAPSPRAANNARRPQPDPRTAAVSQDGVQGEGNYTAARAFNAAERQFVASGKVAEAARAAAPRTATEGQAMLAAEEEGKRRGKK